MAPVATTATSAAALHSKVVQHESAFAAADAAPELDVNPSDQGVCKLSELVSGPLLMAKDSVSDLDGIRDIPFAVLCQDGSKITAKNVMTKLWRCLSLPIKQCYLPFMTKDLPTNYLMLVSISEHRCMRRSAENGGRLHAPACR